jgi:hypothetical protein
VKLKLSTYVLAMFENRMSENEWTLQRRRNMRMETHEEELQFVFLFTYY